MTPTWKIALIYTRTRVREILAGMIWYNNFNITENVDTPLGRLHLSACVNSSKRPSAATTSPRNSCHGGPYLINPRYLMRCHVHVLNKFGFYCALYSHVHVLNKSGFYFAFYILLN